MACTAALVSVAAGEWININGVRFTANAGPCPHLPTEFDISGNDTADAAALVAKINDHPLLRDQVFATNSTNTVTIRQLTGTVGLPVYKESAGTTLGGLSSGLMAAVATVLYTSVERTRLANGITIAATGTGHTASGARLTGGVGSDALPQSFTQ
jgi:hypothetical protein